MFEAEIEDYALLSGAGSDPDRYCDSGDDLQSVAKVVRPSNSRAHEQIMGPLSFLVINHLLSPKPEGFDKKVQTGLGYPYRRLAQVRGHYRSGGAEFIASMR